MKLGIIMAYDFRRTLVILITTSFLILYEASGIIYTLISKGKTLGRTPYATADDAINYNVCVSRCHYDQECLSFDFTPSSPLGRCSFYDVAFEMGDQSLQLVNKPGTSFYSSPPPMRDCADWKKKRGRTTNGVYEIVITGKQRLRVFCNMEEDGGGWIVFQRRFNGNVVFDRTWDEYKEGFGDVSGEHWLGNKWLNILTKRETYDYYVLATSFQGNQVRKKMFGVTVENEALKYRIQFEQEGPDGPRYGMQRMNGMMFSSIDQDNDLYDTSCSSQSGGRGGWWYRSCFVTNMNGRYYQTSIESRDGVVWLGVKNTWESLKETWLMIRPRSFTQS